KKTTNSSPERCHQTPVQVSAPQTSHAARSGRRLHQCCRTKTRSNSNHHRRQHSILCTPPRKPCSRCKESNPLRKLLSPFSTRHSEQIHETCHPERRRTIRLQVVLRSRRTVCSRRLQGSPELTSRLFVDGDFFSPAAHCTPELWFR